MNPTDMALQTWIERDADKVPVCKLLPGDLILTSEARGSGVEARVREVLGVTGVSLEPMSAGDLDLGKLSVRLVGASFRQTGDSDRTVVQPVAPLDDPRRVRQAALWGDLQRHVVDAKAALEDARVDMSNWRLDGRAVEG